MIPDKFSRIFSTLPKDLLTELEKSYNEIKRNFLQHRYEPSELNGAKFCEVVLRILEWHTSGKYAPLGTHIRNFGQSTRKFESVTAFSDSVRFHIPKILNALYDIRSKRGVAHVGNIDPNHMDAVFVVSACDWIMAELVRLFHAISTIEAQKIVEDFVTKKIPLIWDTPGAKRVLNPNLSFKDKTLVILYREHPKSLSESLLFKWVEHSNASVFRRDILRPCHREKLIEYSEDSGEILISPTGMRYVEENIGLEI